MHLSYIRELRRKNKANRNGGSDKQKSNPKKQTVKIRRRSTLNTITHSIYKRRQNYPKRRKQAHLYKLETLRWEIKYKPKKFPYHRKNQDTLLTHIPYPVKHITKNPHAYPTQSKMPTAGEARLVAKRARSPDPNNNTATLAKKTCDPRAESAIPRPIETAFGKRATTKVIVPQATEAQLKQMEIANKAQLEQEALAKKAALAKAAKEAANLQDAAQLPPKIPLPVIPNPVPQPIPGPSTATDVPEPLSMPSMDIFDEVEQADPNFAYPQGYQGRIDLNFIYLLTDDPYKALEIAKNTAEVKEAKQAIADLEQVSYSKK